jgi:hypothetical protein
MTPGNWKKESISILLSIELMRINIPPRDKFSFTTA